MSSKTPAIGDTVQARCTKCRKITSHTIVAMAEELPAEVSAASVSTNQPPESPSTAGLSTQEVRPRGVGRPATGDGYRPGPGLFHDRGLQD